MQLSIFLDYNNVLGAIHFFISPLTFRDNTKVLKYLWMKCHDYWDLFKVTWRREVYGVLASLYPPL